MDAITVRLKDASAGKQTQKLQKEVVVRLDELIKTVENVENRTEKMNALLAELRMIQAMQKRISTRTETYAAQYQGEQVPVPETVGDPQQRELYQTIRSELQELARRQDKVASVTRDLNRGAK